MKIVTTQSEQQLVEMLPLIEKNPGAWMSLHVNIAPLHHQLLNREGLSKALLDKVSAISTQIAHKLAELGLEKFEGSIIVFADSDILALFMKGPDFLEEMLEKVRSEFTKKKLIHILTIEEMKDRLGQLIVLSEEKKQVAENHWIKRRAVEVGENLLEWSEPEAELTCAIQKKRRIRPLGCILAIEDDILMRGVIGSMLKNEHQVLLAKDAASGIIAYIDNAPNIVFLDIGLPDLNGLEVLKRLRQLDPQAYIVMLSGYSSSYNVTSSHYQGAAGFLRKPFPKEKLFQYIGQCSSMGSDATAQALGWGYMKNPLKM